MAKDRKVREEHLTNTGQGVEVDLIIIRIKQYNCAYM